MNLLEAGPADFCSEETWDVYRKTFTEEYEERLLEKK